MCAAHGYKRVFTDSHATLGMTNSTILICHCEGGTPAAIRTFKNNKE